MRVDRLETVPVVVSDRTVWLHVRLHTDRGLSGVAEASLGGQRDLPELARFFALVEGRPLDLEAYRRRGRALAANGGLRAATAFSAIEHALWDLAGKAEGVPAHELLGRRVRDQVPLYANINRMTSARTPEGFARSAERALAAGFRALKAAPFDGFPPRSDSGGGHRGHRARHPLPRGHPRGGGPGHRAEGGLPQPLHGGGGGVDRRAPRTRRARLVRGTRARDRTPPPRADVSRRGAATLGRWRTDVRRGGVRSVAGRARRGRHHAGRDALRGLGRGARHRPPGGPGGGGGLAAQCLWPGVHRGRAATLRRRAGDREPRTAVGRGPVAARTSCPASRAL